MTLSDLISIIGNLIFNIFSGIYLKSCATQSCANSFERNFFVYNLYAEGVMYEHEQSSTKLQFLDTNIINASTATGSALNLGTDKFPGPIEMNNLLMHALKFHYKPL